METKIEKAKRSIKMLFVILLSFLGYIENLTAAISFAIIEFTESNKSIGFVEVQPNNKDNPPLYLIANYDAYLFQTNLYVFYLKNIFEVPDPQLAVINTIFNGESGSRDKMYKTPNKPQFSKNLGLMERIVRFMSAFFLTAYFINGINIEMLSLFVLMLILTLLPTAIFGFCPFYYLAGINSCRKKNKRISPS